MAAWQTLDDATVDEARALLVRCCGSSRWVESMLARRPFGGKDALFAAARDAWAATSKADWLEAFGHHPKIGERRLDQSKFAATRDLSSREQSGVTGAPAEMSEALTQINREYERRFGFIYIVSATGKSAVELLELARTRLTNKPDVELRIAAAEVEKITLQRLARIE